jgi:hypothetical protein
MKKTVCPLICGSLLSVLVMVITCFVYADDGAADPKYGLRLIKPQGFEVYQGILAFVETDEKNGVAFARNKTLNPTDFSLLSYRLNDKGKCSQTALAAEGMGLPYCAAAVWVGAQPERPSRWDEPVGLLFALFSNTLQHPYGEEVILAVAVFAAGGTRLSEWRELSGIKLADNSYLGDQALWATRGGGTVGIVFSLNVMSDTPEGYSYRKSHVFFVETDLDGNRIGPDTSLKLTNQGNYVWSIVYPAAWNGARWVVPISNTVLKSPGTYNDIVGNELLTAAVAGGNNHKSSLSKIKSEKQAAFNSYGDLFFIPYNQGGAPAGVSSPAQGVNLKLFARHSRLIPFSKQRLDLCAYDYKLYEIDQQGKKKQERKIKFPAISHELTYDPAYYPFRDQVKFTPVLSMDDGLCPPSAGGGEDGLVNLSQAYSLWLRSQSGFLYKYEQQFRMFSLDPDSRKVILLGRTTVSWEKALCLQPIIGFLGGRIVVINGAYYDVTPYPRENYFSKFKP